MAIDPRRLRPSELCRLLNSTKLGEVTSERQIYRHRQRAGLSIGDGKTVDLIRYVADEGIGTKAECGPRAGRSRYR